MPGKRIDTTDLKLAGVYRPDRHGDRDKVPEVEGVPVKPSDLKGEAGAYWDKIVPPLVAAGIARSVDAGPLEVVCRAWAAYCLAAAKFEEEPTRLNRVEFVALQVAYMKAAGKVGLCHEDRRKMIAAPKEPKLTGTMAMARKR